MDHLPVNKNVKFAKLLSTNTRFANFSLLAAIAVGTAGLTIITGLRFSPKSLQNPLTPYKVFADSASTPASSFAFAAYDRALASIQARVSALESGSGSPVKLGRNGILTITDSGILKPTDHNQTQGGIGTDVSRIGKIWGTFMDLKDDVSFNGKLDISGKLTANGNVTLGNNDGDEIEIGGRFTSNLVPKKTNDIDIGTTGLRFRTGYFVNSLVIGSGTTTITTSGITTTGGSSTTITSSLLNLVSTGNLQLDTSTNNDNILLLTGTGNVGIGSTAPVYKLDVNGTLRTTGAANITGDLTLDGDLDFTGAQNITTTSDNLTLSPTGNLIIDTSGGTVSIRDAAIDLTNQPTTISGSTLTLRSTGTFILDTSASNTNLRLQAGSGNVQVSSNQLYLTGNLVVTGTETFNGIAYTFPGTQTASGVLTTDGAGILSWGTIGAANITADSLDFAQFDDSFDLDADTSINGPYSFIIRAGQGSIENSTSGNNDLQLSTADKLILGGASFDLSTSSGGVDIISAARIDLSGRGTLTLDTSANNTNIVMTPGTGNIGIGSTAPIYKLDVNGTLRTTSTARIEGALTVTTGGASVTGDLTLDGDLDFTGAQNITTTSDNLTISPNGNLVIDTSGGTVSIRDAAIDLTNQPTTISGSTLTLRSTGTFIIDTSANNTDLRLQAGTGNVQVSSNQLYLTGNLVVTGTETFNGVTYTFPGADGSASNVLTTSGAGLLSWGTLGAASITNDSLDFAQFDDLLDLDADTSINGPYSFIIRAGNAARQNATSGSNDLQLSAEDQILIHGSSMLLETSSASAGQLVIRSDGTLQLDTSANNTNIALQAGSGNINLSSTGTITLTGNTSLNNGTLRLNGLTYTFPGTDTANGVLLTDGSGILSWTTGLTGASLADDTLDFVDLQDELDLDADTSVNGDYSLIIRSGLGSIQNSTSGGNDLQLSAEDKLILGAASFDLLTSSGAVDILSGSYLDLSSKGTLTLDTSANSTNIVLRAGSGNINLSSNTTTISGNVNLNSGTLTLNGVAYTFPGADGSASQALTTNSAGVLSWSTIGVSADSLDFTDLKDTLTMDSDTAVNGDYSFILRAGLGAVQDLTSGSNDIMAAAEDQMFLRSGGFNLTTSSADNSSIILRSTSGGIQLSTGSGSLGEMRLLSSGSLVLDTSLNNSNIRLQAGSGRIDLSGGTILVNSGTGTLTLSSESGVTVGGSLAATGNINSVDGGLQTNGITRIDNSGNITAAKTTTTDLVLGSQASAPASPSEGQVYFNSTDKEYYVYKNAQWTRLAADDRGSCPTGYILVPGSATFGTEDFCVMKYEAKQDADKNPVSTATGAPWVSVDWDEAKAACTRDGAHLISNAEWMTIARNIESTTINDMDDDAGLQLATGHSDNAPAAAQAATAGSDPVVSGCNLSATMENAANAYSAASCEIQGDGSYAGDDNDKGFYGTSQAWSTTGYSAGAANKSQMRTAVLSNGKVIWDIPGNVWEWNDWQCGTSVWNTNVGWLEWNNAGLTDYEKYAAGPSGSLTSANGAGQYYGCTVNRNAALRGGAWHTTTTAGPVALALSDTPSSVATIIGFRCAK